MDLQSLEQHDLGLTWVVDETMARTAHALAHDGRVWIVDPVDHPEAMERVAALGEPAAVVQLLDRHNRDSAAVAARLGVPHLRLPDELPGTPFRPFGVVGVPGWRELALWWPQRRALVVAEALGTAPLFTVGQAPAGMHLMLRLTPPGRLRGYAPEHLLVGHGPALHGPPAAEGVQAAYARSRRDLPRALAMLPSLARG
jgi:hypothetical protein